MARHSKQIKYQSNNKIYIIEMFRAKKKKKKSQRNFFLYYSGQFDDNLKNTVLNLMTHSTHLQRLFSQPSNLPVATDFEWYFMENSKTE